MEPRQNDTRAHYVNIVNKACEEMTAEFERERVPNSVLEQIRATWLTRLESYQAMEPLGKVRAT